MNAMQTWMLFGFGCGGAPTWYVVSFFVAVALYLLANGFAAVRRRRQRRRPRS